MSKKLGWRPPAGSSRAAIAAAALAVIVLIIATYGNASTIRQDDGRTANAATGPSDGANTK